MAEKVKKSEQEWRQQLSPEQFQVTRHAGTEPAFTGKYWKTKDQGTYNCVCCGQALFTSDTKFESARECPASTNPWKKELWTPTRTAPTGWSVRKYVVPSAMLT